MDNYKFESFDITPLLEEHQGKSIEDLYQNHQVIENKIVVPVKQIAFGENVSEDEIDLSSAFIILRDVLKMEDLKPGMILKGTVRNVVDFGVFVDIGVKQDGLVHISEITNKYIKSPHEIVSVGDTIDVSLFQEGDIVDVSGISKGKGFAGVVKRHGFAGGPKTHGQSDRHRHAGSIGATTSPGRVFKGTRMAGRMGGERVTVRRLEVFGANPERNLLLVKGAVPGNRNGLLMIKKSGKGK